MTSEILTGAVVACRSTNEVQQLRAENAALRDALEQLRATAMEGLDISPGHADDAKASVSWATNTLLLQP